jgi:FkbM family methyltransferase
LEPNPPPFPPPGPPDERFRFTVAGIALDLPREALPPPLWRAVAEGWYEDAEIEAIAGALRPGDTVLELGAAVGLISAFAAKRPGVRRVVAVEANPRLVPIARRTHELNGTAPLVELVNAVVVNSPGGEAEFYLHEEFWASSTSPRPRAERVRLPARSLESLLAEVRPDVLIVDIEGGEAGLFEGTRLTGVRTVIVEVHRDVIGPEGVARTFAHLAEAGFAYDPDLSRRHVVVFARL